MRVRGRVLKGAIGAAALVLTCLFASQASAATLYEQMTPKVGANSSIRVTNHPTAPSEEYDTEGADDFTVPTGTFWSVSSIDTLGDWGGNERPSSATIRIYDGTLSPANNVASATASVAWTGNSGNLLVTPTSPIGLGGGHYWISIQPNIPYGATVDFWNWQTAASQNDRPAYFRSFTGWTGTNCASWSIMQNCYSGGTLGPDFTFRLNGSVTSHRLTYTKTGSAAGTVTSTPAGINAISSGFADYSPGTLVDLSFTTSTESTVDGWTGCDSILNFGRTCRVTMNSARNVSANIVPASSITLKMNGSALGGITSEPAKVNCPTANNSCGLTTIYRWPQGTTVTLRASLANNAAFTGWTGCPSPFRNTCTFTMRNDTQRTAEIQANFVDGRDLRINRDGPGTGSLSSSPAGVYCDPDECGITTVFHFPTGTAVTVNATPSAGSAFAGWQGCEQANGASCTMTLSSDKELHPLFDTDADGDGVGDATDGCPDQPGVAENRGCPAGVTPPPSGDPTDPTDPTDPSNPSNPTDPTDPACSKAKAKLKKAKAKVKKLKRTDAPRPKVKKAKAKVKKAKAKVKKVC